MICIVRDVFGHLPQLSDEILRGEHRAIGQRHEIIVLIAASWHAGCDVDAKDASCQIGLPPNTADNEEENPYKIADSTNCGRTDEQFRNIFRARVFRSFLSSNKWKARSI